MAKFDTTLPLEPLRFIKVVLGRQLALYQHQALLIWLSEVAVVVARLLRLLELVVAVAVLVDFKQGHFLLVLQLL
jgi:hypothetical protein